MAAPEFVIADDAFTTYPGGVIAVRCADWLAGARGTLSTESDARSVTGTVVRDTQTVAADIFSAFSTAYAAASTTLTIPLADLPVEPGMPYFMMVSYLIEGDWDLSNPATMRFATQDTFQNACSLSYSGPTVNGSGDGLQVMYRKADGYKYAAQRKNLSAVNTSHTITMKAFAQAGTTIEWLLDQIVLVPSVFSGTVNGEWRNGDFQMLGGGTNAQENVYALDPDNVDPGVDYEVGWVDGADGGDDNGKFTWWPLPITNIDEPFNWGAFAELGGGDYQKDDTEYMARVVADYNDDGNWSDFVDLFDSRDDEVQDPPSHCYGLHGAYYRSARTLVSEDFSRDTGGGHDFQDPDTTPTETFSAHEWGRTPEGYYWSPLNNLGPTYTGLDGHNHGGAIYCNSSGQGVMTCRRGDDPWQFGVTLRRLNAAGPKTGAGITIDGINISGTFEIENAEPGYPDNTPYRAQVLSISSRETLFNGGPFNGLTIAFDMRTGRWCVCDSPGVAQDDFDGLGPTAGILQGPTDVSSWWTYGVEVGFRIEIHRYWCRAKLWEASGGEPGTWDFEDFRDLGATHVVYDYDDLLHRSIEAGYTGQTCTIEMGSTNHRFAGSYIAYFNSLEITYDPVGDEEPTWFSMEVPDGNEVARIEIPPGAQQFVYWGRRAWSVWKDNMFGNYVDFSSKAWNDPDAAELQRADTIFWYWRTVHGAGIVSMNWRSADRRGAADRVLRGDR